MTTTKTINIIMGLEEAQRFLERSDQPIDRPHDAISEAIRILEDTSDIDALRDILAKYKVWVDENQPYSGTANTDGKAMSYADFDEQRADWYQDIVVAAETVAGFTWDEADHIGAESVPKPVKVNLAHVRFPDEVLP